MKKTTILIFGLLLTFARFGFCAEIVTQDNQITESQSVVASKNAVEPKKVTLKCSLLDIIANKVSEKQVDELYLTVTTYPSDAKPSHVRIPDFPKYWLSTHIDKIENLDVWSGKLAEDQNVSVIITLLEHDMPPFNPDDLIGGVKVTAVNDKGTIKVDWKTIRTEDTVEDMQTDKGLGKRLELYGEKAHYSMTFLLDEEVTEE